MTPKKIIAIIFTFLILNATFLSILGIWGAIRGESAFQMVATLVILAIGLGSSSNFITSFFEKQ